ncbi:amino acid permease [Streptomyces sp. NPDC050534]|uniref:amino acid permease n=1 Tax=Streptomyces sp. NPDC050534 TaxID=3365625 RepID=UPI0037923275
MRKPDLNAGVYAYAKAGFGEYLGFFPAFGHWASACVGNVTYWVLIMSTIGAIAPALGDGDTVLSVVLSSVGVWLFFGLISRGVKDAAAISRIVSVLGAYLAWTLMAAEVLFVAAQDDDMPRFLKRSTPADVPVPALVMSTLLRSS